MGTIEHEGLLEERNEKTTTNGDMYYSVKIGGKTMSTFDNTEQGIRTVPVGTPLRVTIEQASKNGRTFNNLKSFSIIQETQLASGVNLRAVALQCAIEYSKTQAFYDDLEKDKKAFEAMLTLAGVLESWLRSP